MNSDLEGCLSSRNIPRRTDILRIILAFSGFFKIPSTDSQYATFSPTTPPFFATKSAFTTNALFGRSETKLHEMICSLVNKRASDLVVFIPAALSLPSVFPLHRLSRLSRLSLFLLFPPLPKATTFVADAIQRPPDVQYVQHASRIPYLQLVVAVDRGNLG